MVAAAALPAIAVAISAASAVAGTASAVYGAYQSSQQQKQQADLARNQAIASAQANEYNAQVQRNNAITAMQNSRMQTDQYFAEAQQKRQMASRKLESNRAALLKSGITESGGALDLFSDISTENALDAQQTEYRGIIEQWNGKVAWNRIQSGATLSDYSAGADRQAADFYGAASKRASSSMGLNMGIAGFGSALSGASSTFGSYNNMNPPSFRGTSYK